MSVKKQFIFKISCSHTVEKVQRLGFSKIKKHTKCFKLHFGKGRHFAKEHYFFGGERYCHKLGLSMWILVIV